jgi:uncharacterized protein (DUF885 family)
MPKILLGLLGLFAAGLLAAAVFVVNLVWFRPFSLDLFYEKAFITFVLEQPELLSTLGIAEQFGWRRHNAHLDDVSIAKGDRDYADLRSYLADLRAYDPAAQTPSQRLSTRVLDWFLQSQVDGERFRFHDYPVNQLFGVQSQTPDFLINQHRIADRRGAEDYIARLGEVGRKFDQVLEGLAERERRGVVPPRFVIERVLAEMRAFVGTPVAEHPLVTQFVRKVDALAGLTPADREALRERCVQAVDTSVRPAYTRMIAFFDGQLARATTDDGVWKLPDGAAYYAYKLRTETSSRLTPDEVHTLGLAEVARIEAEMRVILQAQGQQRDGESPGRALARLAREPRFLYPDNDAGRKAALADYSRMIADQIERSRTLIGLAPKAPIEVRRVPEFREKTAPGAYYMVPAQDGTRPGVFYANLRDMNEVPKFGMRTLAVHEGVPGHHFQLALAQEQKGLPTFRGVVPFTAYSEGWALYAEWLGVEMGLYRDDPFGDLGRLDAELLRAARLVVDTGIHARRWTRAEAMAYMLEHTGMAEPSVVSEVERYIVMPGQACAYMVGMRSIRAARERARAALGERFDAQALRDFHDLVLRGGALPLEVLDEQVDAWIAARRG